MRRITSLVALGLALLLVWYFFLRAHPAPDGLDATVEATAGPVEEVSRRISGIGRLSDGEILVSLKEMGLFSYSASAGWHPLDVGGKIAGLSALANGDVAVSTQEGKLNLFHDSSAHFGARSVGVAFQKVAVCGARWIGMTDAKLFEILPEGPPQAFRLESAQLRSFDCHDDDVLVATEGAGFLSCRISSHECVTNSTQLPSNHVEAVSWNPARRAWWIGLFGDADFSVIEGAGNKWHPLGSHIGDVVYFVPHAEGNPGVLTESGFFFEFGEGDFRRRTFDFIITPPAIEIADHSLLAGSNQDLVMIGKGAPVHLGNPVMIGPDLTDSRIGNSFVWDIVSLPDGVTFASTAQSGVWWSTNGGVSWKPLSEGLTETKVHFIEFNAKTHKLLAGGHSRGLFVCDLPCQKWRIIADPRLPDADLQDRVALSDTRYLIASEHGAIVFNAETERIEDFKPLAKEGKQDSSDLYTAAKVDGRYLVGVYVKKNRPMGAWELKDGKFSQAFNLEYPVTGVTHAGGHYYLGSTQGLYQCDLGCTKILDEPVNRILTEGDKVWLATPHGAGLLARQENQNKILWITRVPAHMIQKAVEPRIYLVGTTSQGVLRIRVND